MQYSVDCGEHSGNIQADTPFLAAIGVLSRSQAPIAPLFVAVWPMGVPNEDSILYFYGPGLVKEAKQRRSRFALVG